DDDDFASQRFRIEGLAVKRIASELRRRKLEGRFRIFLAPTFFQQVFIEPLQIAALLPVRGLQPVFSLPGSAAPGLDERRLARVPFPTRPPGPVLEPTPRPILFGR